MMRCFFVGDLSRVLLSVFRIGRFGFAADCIMVLDNFSTFGAFMTLAASTITGQLSH